MAIAIFSHFIGLQSLLRGSTALGLLTVIPTYAQSMRSLDPRATLPGIFGIEMPLFIQSLVYQFALLFCLYAAAVRKMRSDRAHAYSKPMATAFLSTVAVLGLGSL